MISRPTSERAGHTDLGGVIGSTKDELWSAVVSGADVRDVGLVLDQDLCAAKVTKLQDARLRVQEQVLRFDVSVTDALGVDVGEGAEELVDVQLDLEDGHGGLELVEVSRSAVDGLGDEFEHEVQVDLIFLRLNQSCLHPHFVIEVSDPVTVGVVERLEFDDIGMADDAHDLQFSVLGRGNVSGAQSSPEVM